MTTPDTSHLPPCPFCSSRNLTTNQWDIGRGEVDAIECADCYAGAPLTVWEEQRAVIPMIHGHPKITNKMQSNCINSFEMEIEHACSACAYHGTQKDCEVCGGEIEYTQLHNIPWSIIKKIYKKMVFFALQDKGEAEVNSDKKNGAITEIRHKPIQMLVIAKNKDDFKDYRAKLPKEAKNGWIFTPIISPDDFRGNVIKYFEMAPKATSNPLIIEILRTAKHRIRGLDPEKTELLKQKITHFLNLAKADQNDPIQALIDEDLVIPLEQYRNEQQKPTASKD